MQRYIIFIAFLTSLNAEYISKNVDTNQSKSSITLPYIFSTESTGLTAGAVSIFSGYGQENMTIVATVFAGEKLTVDNDSQNTHKENTRGAFLAISNYQTPFLKRLFVSFLGMYAYFPNQQLYLDGSNDSSRADVITAQGFNNWLEIPMRYILPLGENKDKVITTYKMKNGIPINRDGYGGGTPFITGRTNVEVKPFYNTWTTDNVTNSSHWSTEGLKFSLAHDNTDYIVNPSRGYKFKVTYAQDFGTGKSTQSWNSINAGYSQFIDLNQFSWSRQNVLAFNIWTAYSPSWDRSNTLKDSNVSLHQPPPWEGAHLGGYTRMRAYDMNRFSDKAAIYYGTELRIIPKINPLEKKSWLPVEIDWFQVVMFAELGRVSSHYNFEMLHKDLKYDVGLSLRALAAKLPVRFDIAAGGEGTNMWVMINQPF